MENLDKDFDVNSYRAKLRRIGGEDHIVDITDSEAEQIIGYAESKGLKASKGELTDQEADALNVTKKTTVYIGSQVSSESDFFDA